MTMSPFLPISWISAYKGKCSADLVLKAAQGGQQNAKLKSHTILQSTA